MSERLEERKNHSACTIGLTQLPDAVLKHIGSFCDDRTLKALCCTCVKLKIVYSVILATQAADRIEQSTATKLAPSTFVFSLPFFVPPAPHMWTALQGKRDSADAWKDGDQAGFQNTLEEVLVSAQLVTFRVARHRYTGTGVTEGNASSR